MRTTKKSPFVKHRREFFIQPVEPKEGVASPIKETGSKLEASVESCAANLPEVDVPDINVPARFEHQKHSHASN